MDKNVLKRFAIEARNILRESVKSRLILFGISGKKIETPKSAGEKIYIEANGGIKEYPKKQYNALIKELDRVGYEQLIEEMAYTWFNRFVALRYMEEKGYIREKITTPSGDRYDPEIVDEYRDASFYDNISEEGKKELAILREEDKLEELYAKLVIYKCNELYKVFPFMFEELGDYTELLFPSPVMQKDGFLALLREAVQKDENNELPIEVIGWLYQFYNSEKKDEVFAGLKKNKKISKDNIPAATQLFTPDWIVRYMVENSLGKLALEELNVDESIKSNWKYYIDAENSEERIENSENLKIEEIKVFDPAMGSGHILVYAFDVLVQIYEKLGWDDKEAVESILENNLYGLEIDDRAGQLASFAVMMKARERYGRRFFRVLEKRSLKLNTLAIKESNGISANTRELLQNNKLKNLINIAETFEDAKEYGSILKIENFDYEAAKQELEKLAEAYKSIGQISLFGGQDKLFESEGTQKTLKIDRTLKWDFHEEYRLLKTLVEQGKTFSQKYDVVVTNPPYMGSKGMSPALSKFVKKEYPDTKSDLFAVFMEKCGEYTAKNRYTAMITMHSWMFLSSFEKLRTNIIDTKEINSLVHLGTRAFEDIGGEVVQTVTWVMRNTSLI